METITIYTGNVLTGRSGHVVDNREKVQFEGEFLGEYIDHGTNRSLCGHANARGTTQTLYRKADGQYLVHLYEWSHRQGDPNKETLIEVDEADLRPGGRYADLAGESNLKW